MNTPTLLTPEILTLQPDRAATGGVSSQEWGGILILSGFCHQTQAVRVATVAGFAAGWAWPRWPARLGGLPGGLPGGLDLQGGQKVGHLKVK